MKIAKFKGGMFGDGSGETISCSLCGSLDYDEIVVARLGISVSMSGYEYSFCKKCWFGKNLGKRLLQMLEYPDGMYIKESLVEISEIQDER